MYNLKYKKNYFRMYNLQITKDRLYILKYTVFYIIQCISKFRNTFEDI